MTSRLASFVAQVRGAFADPDAVLGPADVPVNDDQTKPLTASRWYVGGRFLLSAVGWPRIVVVAPSGKFEAARTPGYVVNRGTVDATGQRGASDVRTAQRQRRVLWYIWAANQDQADTILHLLAQALGDVALAIGQASRAGECRIALESEEWANELDEQIAKGGSAVCVETIVPFDLLRSDRNVVLASAGPPFPGAGYANGWIPLFRDTFKIQPSGEEILVTEQPEPEDP